ncbi:MAG: twin-arginine translocase TatA/TatE family subunit [Actinomycetota bacterium]|nr:twin-arginine translocase TatA/TatE family subunit [Actinomycetota bacterium]
MSFPTGWELLLLLGVLVLLFGATKLPTAARAIGQSMRIFKAETKGMRSEDEATSPAPQQPSLPPSGPPATPAVDSQRHNDTSR